MTATILLVHTGGTLGMAPSGDPAALAPGPSLERILKQVPELEQLATFRILVPFNRDSTTLEPGRFWPWPRPSGPRRRTWPAWW
jgi:L-asparaginase/Glu-tRNA(Gln) amidotransferase subunit D